MSIYEHPKELDSKKKSIMEPKVFTYKFRTLQGPLCRVRSDRHVPAKHTIKKIQAAVECNAEILSAKSVLNDFMQNCVSIPADTSSTTEVPWDDPFMMKCW